MHFGWRGIISDMHRRQMNTSQVRPPLRSDTRTETEIVNMSSDLDNIMITFTRKSTNIQFLWLSLKFSFSGKVQVQYSWNSLIWFILIALKQFINIPKASRYNSPAWLGLTGSKSPNQLIYLIYSLLDQTITKPFHLCLSAAITQTTIKCPHLACNDEQHWDKTTTTPI